MAYIPYTLPANAPACIFETAIDGRDQSMHVKTCSASTGATSSFCPEHAYVLEILELGSTLGYPGIDINQFLSIGRGLASWESYILRHPLTRARSIYDKKTGRVSGIVSFKSHEDLKKKLYALIRDTAEQNNAARLNAIHNAATGGAEKRGGGLVDIEDKMYVPF